MNCSCGGHEQRILIVDAGSLLGTGLVHLLMSTVQAAEVPSPVIHVVSDKCDELAGALLSHRPHLVIVPDLDFCFTVEVQHALDSLNPAPTIVRFGPECNEAWIHEQSRVHLQAVGDLLALIPR